MGLLIKTSTFIQAHREAVEREILSCPEVRQFHRANGAFDYSLKGEVLKLTAEKVTRTIQLTTSKTYTNALKKARHYAFLQNRPEETAQKAQAVAVEALGQPLDAAEPVFTGINVVANGLALGRGVGSLISGGVESPVYAQTLSTVVALGGILCVRELQQGNKELKRSQEIGDVEGKHRAIVKMLSGGLGLAASVAFITERMGAFVVSFLSTVHSIKCFVEPFFSALSAMLTPLATILFGAAYFVAMKACLFGIYRCVTFRSRLNEYLNDASMSEKDKMRHTLSYLLSLTTVTPGEEPGETVAHLVEKRSKYFKRRTSVFALKELSEKAPALLERLNRGDVTVIQEAQALVATVRKENTKKILLFTLGFLISFVGFVGQLKGTIATFGMLPFVLYIISALIALGSTLYGWHQIKHHRSDEGFRTIPISQVT